MPITKLSNQRTSNVFVGLVITSSAGSNAITVVRESYAGVASADGGMRMQGVMVTNTLSAFLGFKESVMPQPGSRVLCVEDGSGVGCFIVGIIPQNTTTKKVILPARTCLGAGSALSDNANKSGHMSNTPDIYDHRRPVDVVDGEHVISNEFGVLLGLYQQLANLKASELAQVQCHLLDDLVRIISHNFQHYTALGEYNIYHDGMRLMAEFGATHKPAESYGRPAVEKDMQSPMFQKQGGHTADDESDYYSIKEDERVKAIERFKWFLGGLGDFLHVFLVRPDPKEIRKLDPEYTPTTPDTGLWDAHVGTDGAFHLRSVKEIFIEKTNWIRVPLRKAAPDDPNGDDAEELKYDKKDAFEFKDDFKFKENPFNYALQLRDYVAYVNEKLGYQNFKKHEKDFYVNDHITEENSLKDIGQVDQETSLNLKDYTLRTAGIYLMPNGGITIRDAWNSAIVMEGGNIYLQPAKDMVTQPMRNCIVKAGGNINMVCKKHLDLSSSEQGMRLKAEKALYCYSNKSGIILESNGETDTPGSPDPKESAVEDIGGIVLKSKLSIYNYAEDQIVNYAKKNILLQSLANLDIITDATLTTHSKLGTIMLADTSLLMHATNVTQVLSDSAVVLAGAASTSIGQKDQALGIGYDLYGDRPNPFIDVLYGCLEVSTLTEKLGDVRDAKKDILEQTVFQKEEKFTDLQFKFLSSSQYGTLSPEQDAIPSTIAQQDDLLTNLYELKAWEEQEVNSSLPYPGKDLFENFYYSAEKPANLESNTLGKDYSNKADSVNKPGNITLASLQTYKVYNN
jgi:hypothetical protein